MGGRILLKPPRILTDLPASHHRHNRGDGHDQLPVTLSISAIAPVSSWRTCCSRRNSGIRTSPLHERARSQEAYTSARVGLLGSRANRAHVAPNNATLHCPGRCNGSVPGRGAAPFCRPRLRCYGTRSRGQHWGSSITGSRETHHDPARGCQVCSSADRQIEGQQTNTATAVWGGQWIAAERSTLRRQYAPE